MKEQFQGWYSKSDFLDWVLDKIEKDILEIQKQTKEFYSHEEIIVSAYLAYQDTIAKHPQFDEVIFVNTKESLLEGHLKLANNEITTIEELKNFLKTIR